MIALLIGGTVILCVGLLTVVFGIPIKEFSFGNTMILAGAVVACTGVLIVALYFVAREFKNLSQRFDAGMPVQPASFAVTGRDAAPPRARASAGAPSKMSRSASRNGGDETLFSGDQSRAHDEFEDELSRPVSSLPSSNAPPLSESWQDEPTVRTRAAAPDDVAGSADRPRRDILFSTTKRRDAEADLDVSAKDPYLERAPKSDGGEPFEDAWPQPERARQEPSMSRNGRGSPALPRDNGEAPRERFQPPRRADASSISIVKSGVVDSMAYSLYSDGSIEAQMPEGMVRFASIDELRSHLDQR